MAPWPLAQSTPRKSLRLQAKHPSTQAAMAASTTPSQTVTSLPNMTTRVNLLLTSPVPAGSVLLPVLIRPTPLLNRNEQLQSRTQEKEKEKANPSTKEELQVQESQEEITSAQKDNTKTEQPPQRPKYIRTQSTQEAQGTETQDSHNSSEDDSSETSNTNTTQVTLSDADIANVPVSMYVIFCRLSSQVSVHTTTNMLH